MSGPPAEAVGLTIGFPEGTMQAADVGLRAAVDLLTVEPLFRPEPDGRAVPLLAESWAWENDGLRLRVRLRRGVTFHDGTSLDAPVVADLLREISASPNLQSQYPSLADVAMVSADGEYDVVLDLTRRSGFLPGDLTFPLRSPAGNVGTGPFRVVEGDLSTLERFEDYHEGAPQVGRVTVQVFDSLRPAWASLLRGDLDMVYDVPPDAVDFVESAEVRVMPVSRPYQYLIAFNSARPPFDRPAIRRALNLAIDRSELIQSVLGGNGQPSSGPVGPQFWAYDDAIGGFPFDRAMAVELLESAGQLPGSAAGSSNPETRLRFTTLVPEGFSVVERLAIEVQRYLYNVGVDMEIEVASANDYNIRIRDGEFEAVLIDAISGPTLARSYGFWRSARAFQGGLNVFGYENPESEAIFADLAGSLDNDAAVRTATRRLQSIFLDDPPALFLAWNQRTRAVRRTIEVVSEAGRDPLGEIWRWRPAEAR